MNKINSIIELYQSISRDFKWQNSLYKHLAALTYTTRQKQYTPEKIKSSMKVLKEKTGFFSSFRSHSFLLSVLLCSQYDNPEEMLDKMLGYEEKLKEGGFKSSAYLPISSYSLLTTCDGVDVTSRIHKAYEIYTQIKKLHPWLTTSDDYALCILLSGSDESSSLMVDTTERCYGALRSRGFSRSNGLQFLSHILSLSDESVDPKAERCREIYDKLKQNHLHIYSTYYTSLGLITLTSTNVDDTVAEVVETVNYLKYLKPFRWIGSGMHLLIASSLICMDYIDEKKNPGSLMDTALSVSIEALIAAQQAAMIAGTSAAISASASSSS